MRISFFCQLTFLVAFTGASLAEDWWRVYGEVRTGKFAGGGHRGEEALSDAQKALLKQREFDEWVTYEDEFVKIQYPKHPELKLEKRTRFLFSTRYT